MRRISGSFSLDSSSRPEVKRYSCAFGGRDLCDCFDRAFKRATKREKIPFSGKESKS